MILLVRASPRRRPVLIDRQTFLSCYCYRYPSALLGYDDLNKRHGNCQHLFYFSPNIGCELAKSKESGRSIKLVIKGKTAGDTANGTTR